MFALISRLFRQAQRKYFREIFKLFFFIKYKLFISIQLNKDKTNFFLLVEGCSCIHLWKCLLIECDGCVDVLCTNPPSKYLLMANGILVFLLNQSKPSPGCNISNIFSIQMIYIHLLCQYYCIMIWRFGGLIPRKQLYLVSTTSAKGRHLYLMACVVLSWD